MRFPQSSPTIEDTLERFWPVGSIYPSVVSANPAVTLGFGTWVAFGSGRAIVGVDPGDSDFDAAEKTSGAKTVALVESELPAHSHAVNDPQHSHVQGVNSATTGGTSGYTPDTSTNTRVNSGYSTSPASTGITIANTGGGGAHNNVQPSIAVYLWKRTA